MSVKSNTFGNVVLSGDDARAFVRKLQYAQPKKAAVAAVRRGLAFVDKSRDEDFISLSLVQRKVATD